MVISGVFSTISQSSDRSTLPLLQTDGAKPTHDRSQTLIAKGALQLSKQFKESSWCMGGERSGSAWRDASLSSAITTSLALF